MRSVLFLCLFLALPSPLPALSPRLAVTAALNDADQQAIEDAPFLRYLYHPRPEEDTDFPVALRLHVNLISREASFAYPTLVAEGLWRVDIREFRWDRSVFEALANIDPYFHQRVTKEVVEEIVEEVEYDQPYGYHDAQGQWHRTEVRREKRREVRQVRRQVVKNFLYAPQAAGQLASLALLTDSQVPIVRADWFLVQGARQLSLTNRLTGAGYADWLGLKSRDDFFKLIGQGGDSIHGGEDRIKAVVRITGVSAQNRQIVRDGAVTGPHWTTFDTFDQSGAGVAINTLRDGEFRFDAQEHYGFLNNGLPAFYANDNRGVQQDSVPDKIGGNRSPLNTSNDLRIHLGPLSCMQCHGAQVLQPFECDARATYQGRLQVLTNDKGLGLELKRQYGSNYLRPLQRDREALQDAFTTVTGGKTPADAVTIYSGAFTRYAYRAVTVGDAARELGTTTPQLQKALRDAASRLGRGDFRTDTLMTAFPRPIPRLDWEDSYADTQNLLYGILKENP